MAYSDSFLNREGSGNLLKFTETSMLMRNLNLIFVHLTVFLVFASVEFNRSLF